MQVFTIGYEGVDLDTFLDVLQAQGVRTVVDVRDIPLSRKPGFSKTPLSIALNKVGIQYVHERVLGTPKPIREALKQTGNWKAYERSYLSFLKPREKEFARILRYKNICLLCFEANPLECHRSLVAKRMEELKLIKKVRHLSPLLEELKTMA